MVQYRKVGCKRWLGILLAKRLKRLICKSRRGVNRGEEEILVEIEQGGEDRLLLVVKTDLKGVGAGEITTLGDGLRS